MRFLQPITTRHNGTRRIKLLILLIIIGAIMVGCSGFLDPGEGRGDWSMALYSGYEITKINSKGIKVTRDDPVDGYLLYNYFVTGFQAKEPYVCFRGIPTYDTWISDEELAQNKTVYYLLNTDTDELSGPFATFEELYAHCETVSVFVKDQWIDIDRKSSKPPKIGNTGMVVPERMPWHDKRVSSFQFADYADKVEEFPSEENWGRVTDVDTLLEKTEQLWIQIYGKETILGEKPYQVFYDEQAGIWFISGTLPEKYSFGGVANILVENDTGDVLAVWHEK